MCLHTNATIELMCARNLFIYLLIFTNNQLNRNDVVKLTSDFMGA